MSEQPENPARKGKMYKYINEIEWELDIRYPITTPDGYRHRHTLADLCPASVTWEVYSKAVVAYAQTHRLEDIVKYLWYVNPWNTPSRFYRALGLKSNT